MIQNANYEVINARFAVSPEGAFPREALADARVGGRNPIAISAAMEMLHEIASFSGPSLQDYRQEMQKSSIAALAAELAPHYQGAPIPGEEPRGAAVAKSDALAAAAVSARL